MKKIIIFFAVSFLIVGVLLFLQYKGLINWRIYSFEKNKATELEVVFMDIGQGDAALLKFPNGQTMLVDCGPDAIILGALGRNLPWNARVIDHLVITHPHVDHYGGCIDVLARFQVKAIYLTGFVEKPNDFLISLQNAIAAEQVADGAQLEILSATRFVDIGSTTLNFLYPDHDLAVTPQVPGEKSIDTNDSSIVIKVSHGSQDILLTGDMEAPLEEYLLKKDAAILNSEILKAGHHGSRSSSGEEFLATVQPKAVVISAGEGNSYGHPHRNIVYRLEHAGATVWRTDVGGDILAALTTSTFDITYASDSRF